MTSYPLTQINNHADPYRSCAAHGPHGKLPCPWPGCVNGIHGDYIEDSLGEKKKTFNRREWQSPLGGSYFSWAVHGKPHFNQVKKLCLKEARRHGLQLTSKTKVVYHYTSLEGFMGIINSRSVWMTDFLHLNDLREVNYGLGIFLDTIRPLLEVEKDEVVRGLLFAWCDYLSDVTKAKRIYIASFCGDGDSLSQWRAYGPIAIGFEVGPLEKNVPAADLRPVEYTQAAQRDLAKIYVHQMLDAFVADLKDGHLQQTPCIYHEPSRLLELSVFFKNPAFKSENEYRLAYIDEPEAQAPWGIKSPHNSFRVVKGRIVPYVPSTEVRASNVPNSDLAISEVILGPECDALLERGVREFLRAKGLALVNVRNSLIPLRS